MEIVPLAEADLGQAYELCERAFCYHVIGECRFARYVEEVIDDSLFGLVGVEDGKLVGLVSARRVDEETAQLVLVCSHPAYGGRGIGGALYERVERALREAGVRRVDVGPSPFFSGLDLRYRKGAVFLMRRLYVPKEIVYDQLAEVDRLDLDVSAEERRLAAEGITFRKLSPDDAGSLERTLKEHFPGWLGVVERVSNPSPDDSAHAAFAGDEVVAFAFRNVNNFGPTGTVPAYRRRGIGSVLFYRLAAEVKESGWSFMVVQVANFMYYARAFALPVLPVWRMSKDLTQNGAVKKAR